MVLRLKPPLKAAVADFAAANAIIYFTMSAAAVCVRLEQITREFIWLL